MSEVQYEFPQRPPNRGEQTERENLLRKKFTAGEELTEAEKYRLDYLQAFFEWAIESLPGDCWDCHDKNVEIERLRAENAKLQDAIKEAIADLEWYKYDRDICGGARSILLLAIEGQGGEA